MAEKSDMEKYYGLLSRALNNLKDVKEACEGYYEVLVEPTKPGKTKAYKCVFRLRQNYLNGRTSRQTNSPGMTINQYYEDQLRDTTASYYDFMQLTHLINSWLFDIRKEFSRDKYKIIVLTQVDEGAEAKTHPDPDSDSESEHNFNNDSDCESDEGSTPKPYIKKCTIGHTQIFPINSKKTKLRICTECLDTLGEKYKFAIYTYDIMPLH